MCFIMELLSKRVHLLLPKISKQIVRIPKRLSRKERLLSEVKIKKEFNEEEEESMEIKTQNLQN